VSIAQLGARIAVSTSKRALDGEELGKVSSLSLLRVSLLRAAFLLVGG
jgi:hypothetical protein